MSNPKITEPTPKPPGSTRRIPRLQIKNHQIGSGVLTGLGGVLMALELPFLGLPAACLGGGYLLATYLLSGVLKAGDEDVNNWVTVLDEREKTLAARAAELKEDKAAAKKLIAEIEEKMRETEQQARRVELDLKAKYDKRLAASAAAQELEYKVESEAAIAAAQGHSLTRIKHHKSRLVNDNRQLHEEIEGLRTKLEQRDAYLLGEFNKRIESYQTGYSEIQQAIDIQGRNVGEARAAFEAQYEALLGERDRLVDELRRLKAPRRFQFKGLEYDTANDIQQFLQERGIILACHSVGRNHYGSVPLHFEAVSPHGASAIQPHLEPLQLRLGLPERPKVEVKDGGLIEILVQLSREIAPKKKITIVDPPLSRLEAAINESIHVRIAAPSGSGKSVMLGNLINYLCSTFLPDYKLSDPKVTAPEVWGDIQPDYYSYECLNHLFGLAADVFKRIDQAKDAVKSGKPFPKFEPQFHVIDELEILYSLLDIVDDKQYTPKLFKTNTKIALKAGREHKIKLLFVTQSPLPSELNLRRDDFFNTSSLLLGNCISMALDSASDQGALLADVPREKIAQLKAEYEARLARGDEYIFLFYNPAKPLYVWFGKCPPPGYYASGTTAATPQAEFLSTPDFEGSAPRHLEAVSRPQSLVGQSVQPATSKAAQVEMPPPAMGLASTPATPVKGEKDRLQELLNQGSYCPDCGSHSASYKKKKPNGSGNVILRCKNAQCDSNSFSWNVIAVFEGGLK